MKKGRATFRIENDDWAKASSIKAS